MSSSPKTVGTSSCCPSAPQVAAAARTRPASASVAAPRAPTTAPLGPDHARDVVARRELVRLPREKQHLGRRRPVVREHGDVAPAGPGELDPERVERRHHLRLARPRLPPDSERRVGARVDRRLEQHLPAEARHPVEPPEELEVEGAVVEDAEEEHEVERRVLVQPVRVAEVTVDPRMRRAEPARPWLMQVPVLLEVGEREDEGFRQCKKNLQIVGLPSGWTEAWNCSIWCGSALVAVRLATSRPVAAARRLPLTGSENRSG